MRIAVTGASGIVGGHIVRGARAAGHGVETLPGWRLGMEAPLDGIEALVHAAFAHAPGRYRGGEGDDPAAFVAANLDGSAALFAQARAAGVGRVVFLSSRAVYDAWPDGTPLPDGTPARPASLYGRVKAEAEAVLAGLVRPGFAGAAIRATGVYGPGQANKWRGLFADYLAGRAVAPRVATELHGDDLAAAVLALLAAQGADGSGGATGGATGGAASDAGAMGGASGAGASGGAAPEAGAMGWRTTGQGTMGGARGAGASGGAAPEEEAMGWRTTGQGAQQAGGSGRRPDRGGASAAGAQEPGASEPGAPDAGAAARHAGGPRVPTAATGAFNASDLILDRQDLLAAVAALTGCAHPLPDRADAGALSVMGTARLDALGWRPGGRGRLAANLPQMVAEAAGPRPV